MEIEMRAKIRWRENSKRSRQQEEDNRPKKRLRGACCSLGHFFWCWLDSFVRQTDAAAY